MNTEALCPIYVRLVGNLYYLGHLVPLLRVRGSLFVKLLIPITATATTASKQLKQTIIVPWEPQTLGKDLDHLDQDRTPYVCDCTETLASYPCRKYEKLRRTG